MLEERRLETRMLGFSHPSTRTIPCEIRNQQLATLGFSQTMSLANTVDKFPIMPLAPQVLTGDISNRTSCGSGMY